MVFIGGENTIHQLNFLDFFASKHTCRDTVKITV
jgi:hypothetical protein